MPLVYLSAATFHSDSGAANFSLIHLIFEFVISVRKNFNPNVTLASNAARNSNSTTTKILPVPECMQIEDRLFLGFGHQLRLNSGRVHLVSFRMPYGSRIELNWVRKEGPRYERSVCVIPQH